MSRALARRKYSAEVNSFGILKSMGYTLGKTIGQGTYSKVCLTIDQNGQKFACKIINKKIAGADFIRKFLPRELEIVSKIQHDNIVNIFKIIEIDCVIYMLMDYCRNGDLLEYIRCNGPMPEDEAKCYFRQIVSALEYLHNMNIAHRDMKCENVFITANNMVMLGDFGFARSTLDETTGKKVFSDTFCGSAAYAAPEILQGIAYDPKMFDIWALGCVLFIMLTATMPFDDCNIKRMIRSQLNKSICSSAYATWDKNSTALKNLLSNLLEPQVKKRATIKQVANCQWLQESALKRYKRMILSFSEGGLI